MKIAIPAGISGSSGMSGLIGRNVSAKVLVLGVSGIVSVLTTRLMIDHFGVAAYAQFGLLATMTSLLPFADLGVAAAVVNRMASSLDPSRDPEVTGTLVSALRLLLASATTILAIGAVITLTGLWPALLGRGLLPDGSTAAFFCLALFALALPLGLGQRILNGLMRNHIYTLIQGLAAPSLLLGVSLVIAFDGAAWLLPVVSYLAVGLVAVVSFWVAARALRPQVRCAVRAVFRRDAPTMSVLNLAWPMLLQMVALPIAMQTDRLLLSHLGRDGDLGQYNLAAQLFGLILQTVTTTGMALWPVYAKARSEGEVRSPVRLSYGFGLGALLAAGAFAAALPWLVPLISAGKIRLDVWLVVGFCAFLTVQAVKFPLGMYMTDARGLRFQVPPIMVLVPVNLGVSWALIGPLGAAGPIVGSALAVTLCQVVPNLWYVHRDLKTRRADATQDTTATSSVA